MKKLLVFIIVIVAFTLGVVYSGWVTSTVTYLKLNATLNLTAGDRLTLLKNATPNGDESQWTVNPSNVVADKTVPAGKQVTANINILGEMTDTE